METTIDEIRKERDLLESQINTLLATFAHKYPKVKLSVYIERTEYRDEASRMVESCFDTNIKISL